MPPTAMFRASIVLVNQFGGGDQIGPMISPAIPEPRNTTRYATYQRAADRTSLNTSAPSGARIPHRPTPEANSPSDRCGEQDVDLAHLQEPGEVVRPREHGDRTEQDDEVDERHDADRRSERQIQRAPHHRDRQDLHRDQHQQRLARRSSSSRIRADERDASRRRSDRVQKVHDVTRAARTGTRTTAAKMGSGS